jgi:starch phosphorylase
MLYAQGYFRQWIDLAGRQRERYPDNDFAELPVSLQVDANGNPLIVRVPITDRDVAVRIWRLDVGRVPLILLDASVAENRAEDRELTLKLYHGDVDVRIRQEILLGIGGMRALTALGLAPSVAHMNEGHSAFLVLERLRDVREASGLSADAAWQIVRASNVFTTHTPVAAGHDEFSAAQIERHLGTYLEQAGISAQELLALGRTDPQDAEAPLGVTQLALRSSAWRNGVSALHGQVSRQMWQRLWPQVPVDEVPIAHVTNGIHLRSWVAPELAELFEQHIAPDWAERAEAPSISEGIGAIPDAGFWRVHVRRREHLITSIRRRLRQQVERRGGSEAELAEAANRLDPEVLTIGFARRFAVYKRPTLLLQDLERLRALLGHESRPIQIIFAGKAHPRDEPAKSLVHEIVELGHDPALEGRLVFVEDYDISLARDLVQGCDVWLNNPVRPQEASGTSGMKAAANGGLNLSVLDGWWAEAYAPEAGWAIGRADDDQDGDQRDASDAAAIYHLLEQTVAPLFYDRGGTEVPAGWIAKAKAAMILATARFGANRMLREYAQRFYLPAHDLGRRLRADRGAAATRVAEWLAQVREQWDGVRVLTVVTDSHGEQDLGAEITVRAQVALNGLRPEDVAVQMYVGRVTGAGELASGRAVDARPTGEGENAPWFEAPIRFERSGRVGVAVRVAPRHADLAGAHETGLVRWSDATAGA